MSHVLHRLFVIPVLLVCLMALAAVAQDAPPMPALAYKLQPGQVITYEVSSKLGGSMDVTANAMARATVLAANPDGSHRVLLAVEWSRTYGENQARKSVEVIAFDLSPDGQITSSTRTHSNGASQYFPPLPRPGQAQWESTGGMGDLITYRLGDAGADGHVMIHTVSSGPMADIYGIREETTLTFDPGRGLFIRQDTTTEQTYGVTLNGSGVTELKSVETVDPAELKTLAEEAAVYFDAVDAHYKLMEHYDTDAAKADLEAAVAKLTAPAFRDKLQRDLEQLTTYEDYYKQAAAERAKIIGQAAPDWELKDLAGQTHKLADYRGKVVVLDFWYRGCGWCIRAMPQMNQLVDDLKGKPVAILGINNDGQVPDAEFVAEKMRLKYPTLLGPEIPEKYGVRAFPTLLFIDQQGVIRDMHVGWAPDLRQQVTAKVEALLAP